MTDYPRDIGGGTTIMIRDLENGWVEFWVKTGASTYNYQQEWSYAVGGFNPGRLYFRMEKGGNWQRAGNHYYGDIGLDYDIGMSIQNSGIGFPSYGFSVHVSRARPPAPPVPPHIFGVGDTWIDIGWGGDGGWGGASITGREFWWSTDGIARNLVANGGARFTLGGLWTGGSYNIWARNGNSAGWSGFSGASYVRTLRIPDAPTPVGFYETKQHSTRTTYTYDGKWDGGTPVREWQIGYGRDPNVAQAYVSGVDVLIDNLVPGAKYYFWARGRNDIGWGPWSVRSEVQLHAGAYVNVQGVWKNALPWVKVNGVWRLTTPRVADSSTWRETS